MVSFALGCALFALCLAMSPIEFFLEVGPSLMLWCCFKPAITVIKADAGFVNDGISCINNLLICEGYVAGLGVGLDFFDMVIESLDQLA
jgi:hypothetical protein